MTMISKLLLLLFNFNSDTKWYGWEGFDSRYSLKDPNIDAEFERIVEIHHKKNILDLLNSSRISIYDKLLIIKNESMFDTLTPNLYKAGLLDDWDFEI